MPASISKRAFIQWLPDKPSEKTSTLVLTSHEGYYVDIRILKPMRVGEKIDQDQLDWAFAGSSTTGSIPTDQYGLKKLSTKQYAQFVDDLDGFAEEPSDDITHTTWKHTVDSRFEDTTDVSDQGDMLSVPDLGMTLEAGNMINPATGKATDYREGWIDVDIEPPTTCQVLELQVPGATGMLIRLGQWLQAVSRHGTEFNLQRWRLVEDDWVLYASMGDGLFPIEAAVNDNAMVGTIFEVTGSQQGTWRWKIIESSSV